MADQLYLRHRFLVRYAIDVGLIPIEKLMSDEWSATAESETKFDLLYRVSSLIVRLISDTAGDTGLRALVEG